MQQSHKKTGGTGFLDDNRGLTQAERLHEAITQLWTCATKMSVFSLYSGHDNRIISQKCDMVNGKWTILI